LDHEDVQGVPLKRALYFMGVAKSESMIGGVPVTYGSHRVVERGCKYSTSAGAGGALVSMAAAKTQMIPGYMRARGGRRRHLLQTRAAGAPSH
jgi:hypothetical protein